MLRRILASLRLIGLKLGLVAINLRERWVEDGIHGVANGLVVNGL